VGCGLWDYEAERLLRFRRSGEIQGPYQIVEKFDLKLKHSDSQIEPELVSNRQVLDMKNKNL
jgi:hypothetical protein